MIAEAQPMGTLREAVESKFGKAAWALLCDEGSATHVRRKIGPRMTCDDGIVTDMPFEQLMMATCSADFASDDEERVSVARMIHWLIDKPDALPMVHCHRGFDLASRCLVSISLFRRAMEWRTRFRGCPTVGFYRAVGIGASRASGMDGVAEHFDNWSGFIGEMLGG